MSDFEQKKQILLKQLSQIKTQQKLKKKVEFKNVSTSSTQVNGPKKCIAIFGNQSLFLKSIKDSLEQKFDVKLFNHTTEAIDSCAESSIKKIIIDIDDPASFKSVLEIMGNLREVQPDTTFLCCTKDSGTPNARIIEQKGGTLINKPVNFSAFIRLLT